MSIQVGAIRWQPDHLYAIPPKHTAKLTRILRISVANEISRAFEIKMGLNPAVIDANEDPDGDNLDNIEEYRNGTDPFDFDTDGDNLSDGDEINTHSIQIAMDLPMMRN